MNTFSSKYFEIKGYLYVASRLDILTYFINEERPVRNLYPNDHEHSSKYRIKNYALCFFILNKFSTRSFIRQQQRVCQTSMPRV